MSAIRARSAHHGAFAGTCGVFLAQGASVYVRRRSSGCVGSAREGEGRRRKREEGRRRARSITDTHTLHTHIHTHYPFLLFRSCVRVRPQWTASGSACAVPLPQPLGAAPASADRNEKAWPVSVPSLASALSSWVRLQQQYGLWMTIGGGQGDHCASGGGRRKGERERNQSGHCP